jgi:hypothetical protein
MVRLTHSYEAAASGRALRYPLRSKSLNQRTRSVQGWIDRPIFLTIRCNFTRPPLWYSKRIQQASRCDRFIRHIRRRPRKQRRLTAGKSLQPDGRIDWRPTDGSIDGWICRESEALGPRRTVTRPSRSGPRSHVRTGDRCALLMRPYAVVGCREYSRDLFFRSTPRRAIARSRPRCGPATVQCAPARSSTMPHRNK